MPPKRLRTVSYRPDPRRHAVIDCQPGVAGPYFEAEGDEDSVCGACGHPLIRGQLVAILTLYICCPDCGTFNIADGHH